MKLSRAQIEFFHTEGWLFLPELFSPEETAFLAREAEGIYAADRPEVWREKSGAPRTAFAAHLYNDAFATLGARPRMIEPIEQVFGEGFYMHQLKINAKSAFTDDPAGVHRSSRFCADQDGRGGRDAADADRANSVTVGHAIIVRYISVGSTT